MDTVGGVGLSRVFRLPENRFVAGMQRLRRDYRVLETTADDGRPGFVLVRMLVPEGMERPDDDIQDVPSVEEIFRCLAN